MTSLPDILCIWLQEAKIKDWEVYRTAEENFLQHPTGRNDLNDRIHFSIQERRMVKCCNGRRPDGRSLDASDPDFFKKLEVWMKEE